MSVSADVNPGSLPSAQRVTAHLAEHPPQAPAAWLRWVPLGVVLLAVLVSTVIPGALGFLLPWVALAGTIAWGVKRRKDAADASRRALYAQELSMLRHHRPALRLAWTLIPELVHRHDEHARTVALLGHLLQTLDADESAVAVYDDLLGRLPDGHPAALTLRLQKATAAFQADELSDGDAELRRVRGAIREDDPGPIGAAYRATRLLQAVRTHHFAEATEMFEHPANSFRALGLEAGMAHGLLAYARLRTGDVGGSHRAWSDATCLVPAQELIRRYAPLREIVEIRP